MQMTIASLRTSNCSVNTPKQLSLAWQCFHFLQTITHTSIAFVTEPSWSPEGDHSARTGPCTMRTRSHKPQTQRLHEGQRKRSISRVEQLYDICINWGTFGCSEHSHYVFTRTYGTMHVIQNKAAT